MTQKTSNIRYYRTGNLIHNALSGLTTFGMDFISWSTALAVMTNLRSNDLHLKVDVHSDKKIQKPAATSSTIRFGSAVVRKCRGNVRICNISISVFSIQVPNKYYTA